MQTVGIDLGTTYSCIARFKNGTVEIIPNDQGQRVTPSVVCFADGERMVGEGAVNFAHRQPEQVIFDNKRMIGRDIDDPDLQKEIKQWPFIVAKASNSNKPVIKVMVDKEEKEYYPEEISALVLGKMREIAETYTGDKIGGAVVTVPAYFNDSQRQSTKDAGTIAGLNVLRIINEPTAAAIAYGLDKKGEKEQHALIFDLGGGTFDVSFIAIEDGVFEVKATKGDTHLGGRDFDNILLTRMVQEFKKTSGKDITDNKRAISRLRTAIERSKRVLSSAMQVTIEVDGLYQSMDFYHTLTRARFNEMCEPFFDKCIEIVKDCMADAKVDKKSVDQVVCVGGSTRIPRVIEKLTQFFEKEPFRSINPDEAIAYGAAVQAAILGGDKDEAIKDVLLLDVCALSLGVETAGGIMAVVVPKNTTVPTQQTQVFTTSADGQTSVEIKVFEGERTRTCDCHCLGVFTVTNIPPAPRGTPQIEVSLNVSNDGILSVAAVEKKSGARNKIEINKRAANLSQEYIQKAMADAEKNSELDKKIKEASEKRNELENYVYSVKTACTQHKDKYEQHEIQLMENTISEAYKVIDQHKDLSDSAPFVQCHNNCKEVLQKFMDRIYQDGAGGAAGPDPGAAGAGANGGAACGGAGGYPFGGSSPYSGGAAGPDCGASGPTVEEVD